MATIADFVGTWFFRGVRNRPCYIRLNGVSSLTITNEEGRTFPGHVENQNVLVTEDRLNWGLKGVLNSNANRIAWANGESWER